MRDGELSMQPESYFSKQMKNNYYQIPSKIPSYY